MPSKFVVDIETTVNGPYRSPGAEYPDNRELVISINGGSYRHWDVIVKQLDLGPVVVVGHNVMFDIKYLLRYIKENYPDLEWWDKLTVIDTMYEVYLQSGHTLNNMSLEDTAQLYNIPYEKSIDLASYLSTGHLMEDIPIQDLMDYCDADCNVTRLIHEKQLKVRSLESMMDAHKHLIFLAEMELTGLPINKTTLQNKLLSLLPEQVNILSKLVEMVQTGVTIVDRHGKPNLSVTNPAQVTKFDWVTGRVISKVLTGMPTGVIKTSRLDVNLQFPKPLLKYSDIVHVWGSKPPSATLGYSLAEESVHALEQLEIPGVSELVSMYSRYKQIEKLHSTYLRGMSEVVNNPNTPPCCLFPSINTTVTATGRTSSSNPNGQNFPPDAKECIGYENGRKFYEFDLSQLEMCGAAELSQDPTMIEDIQHKRDIHYETGRTTMGWKSPTEMTDKTRRQVKGVNFSILYGAGIGTISKNTGLSKEETKKLVKGFYDRYPGVRQWQQANLQMVRDNKEPNGFVGGEQRYSSTFTCGGVKHTIFTDVVPWLGPNGRQDFSPTKVYNYPIQGWAGERVVPNWLYKVGSDSDLRKKGMLLHMMVHDSILLSFPELNQLDHDNILIRMNKLIKATEQQLKVSVPLKIDHKVGYNWSFK